MVSVCVLHSIHEHTQAHTHTPLSNTELLLLRTAWCAMSTNPPPHPSFPSSLPPRGSSTTGSLCSGLFSASVLGVSSSAPNLWDYVCTHYRKSPPPPRFAFSRWYASLLYRSLSPISSLLKGPYYSVRLPSRFEMASRADVYILFPLSRPFQP